MTDARSALPSVLTPTATLEALGLVDLSDPVSPGHAPGNSGGSSDAAAVGDRDRNLSTPSTSLESTPGTSSSSTATATQYAAPLSLADLSTDALGLPPDAQIIRVPEGERYRVRAVYDFDATDESALSFRAGDVIEVLTMLPSGWWDGMLGTSRGWFPSNYVEDADDDLYDGDYVEMAHDGRVVDRNGTATEVLAAQNGVGSSAGPAWNHWAGDSATSLDDLAQELMAGGGASQSDLATARRPTSTSESSSQRGTVRDDKRALLVAPAGAPDARHTDAWVPSLTGDGRLYYHNTQTGEDVWDIPEGESEAGDTISRAESRASTGQQDTLLDQHYPSTSHPAESSSRDNSHRLSAQSHERARAVETANTQRRLEQRDYHPHPHPHVHAQRGSSSRPSSMQRSDDPFRVPPNRTQGGVPYPWVARLTDDGKGYIYINQATGEKRADAPPPAAASQLEPAPVMTPPRRSSLPANANVAVVTGRSSMTTPAFQNYATVEWEQRIAGVMEAWYTSAVAPNPTIGSLVDKIKGAVREVYEAAEAGAAAEDDYAAALESHTGLAAATLADEAAVSAMTNAYEVVLASVRELFTALGYVGPSLMPILAMDSVAPDEPVRPSWANDVSLLGAVGALWQTTHAAETGLRVAGSDESPWERVMRASLKLRVLLDTFPALALPDLTDADREKATGMQIVAWFGADALAEFVPGKFGFGNTSEGVFTPLDQTAVLQVQKFRVEVDAALRAAAVQPDGAVLDIARATTNFSEAVNHIDIAIAIDLDGAQGPAPDGSPEDAKAYSDLVGRAHQAIRDLEDSCILLDSAAADIFLSADATATSPQALDALSRAVGLVSRALSTVFVVAQEQAATVEQGVVRGSIGHRSPSKRPEPMHLKKNHSIRSFTSIATHGTRQSGDLGRVQAQHTRDASIASTDSQRTRATGSEQEFVLDSDEQRNQRKDKRASNRLSRASQSGSASQTSLVKPGGPSSSSTSLLQDSSETGSMRGSNRSSILKAVPSFLRTRSGSEAERTRSRKGSRMTKTPTAQLASPSEEGSPSRPTAVAPPVAPPASAHGPQPSWYNEPDYDPSEIVLDEDKGVVKAGTIRALIVRLTAHTSADTAFFQAFMLTYRSFVDTEQLVKLLFERYNIEPPADLEAEEVLEWKLRKQRPIQLRVANVFKAWLGDYFMEDKDQVALDMVESFATGLQTDGGAGTSLMAKQLLQLVERRRRGDSMLKNRVITGGLPPPSPIPTRGTGGKALSLLDINPLELARQLTVIESSNFTAIKPVECLNKAFRVNPKVDAPHISATTDMANALAGMIQTQILGQQEVKQRAAIIKHLIRTATECHGLNNFSSMAAVIAGLSMSPIRRLKRTWAELGDKPKQQLVVLEQLMDPTRNFYKYHEMLKSINPPCVPFIGVYLTALVFIEDGNRDLVPNPADGRRQSVVSPLTMTSSISSTSTNLSSSTTATSLTAASSATELTANGASTSHPTLINFFKRSLTADILRDIVQYQSAPYNLQTYKPVQDWVKRAIEMPYPPADDLWAKSLALEPKEPTPTDEKHTKFLQALGGYVPGVA